MPRSERRPSRRGTSGYAPRKVDMHRSPPSAGLGGVVRTSGPLRAVQGRRGRVPEAPEASLDSVPATRRASNASRRRARSLARRRRAGLVGFGSDRSSRDARLVGLAGPGEGDVAVSLARGPRPAPKAVGPPTVPFARRLRARARRRLPALLGRRGRAPSAASRGVGPEAPAPRARPRPGPGAGPDYGLWTCSQTSRPPPIAVGLL